MTAFIHNNAVWLGPVALWALSAAISAMPAPEQTSSQFYRWLYGFSHLVGGNLDKVASSVKPPIK